MEDDAETEILRGCRHTFLYAVAGFAWFFAAHQAVWWYARACHNPGVSPLILVALPADLVVMTLAVLGVHRLHRRLWPHLRWWTPAVLLAAALLVTWLYWVINIPLFVDPYSPKMSCWFEHPDGWPSWIPVPTH
ncbi:hypothetical protein GCM10017786_42940 [Amycolatopsis deserti]|uniref:DUF2637 domain-containing protein n=1 Tax=Amycolatopsis deserti TaxID=185696 RepID=A0ABQ3J6L1_9PSEU|nr:hypothetical protein [Amycolatopsis deserti]GHF04887.1 hypothetical protein GCM10017786_42940 [Amycolatopsis deserti]